MNGPGTQPYRIGFGDHNAFVWAWIARNSFTRRSLPRFVMTAGAIVLFSLFYVFQAFAGGNAPHAMVWVITLSSLLVSIVFAAILVYGVWPLLTWAWQMLSFTAGPARRPAQSVRLTSEGIEKTMDGASHLFAWESFQDLSVKGSTLLLFNGRNSAMIVPRSAFATPADAEAFAVAAAARVRRAPHKDPAENF